MRCNVVWRTHLTSAALWLFLSVSASAHSHAAVSLSSQEPIHSLESLHLLCFSCSPLLSALFHSVTESVHHSPRPRFLLPLSPFSLSWTQTVHLLLPDSFSPQLPSSRYPSISIFLHGSVSFCLYPPSSPFLLNCHLSVLCFYTHYFLLIRWRFTPWLCDVWNVVMFPVSLKILRGCGWPWLGLAQTHFAPTYSQCIFPAERGALTGSRCLHGIELKEIPWLDISRRSPNLTHAWLIAA